jgi:hypothetical protein
LIIVYRQYTNTQKIQENKKTKAKQTKARKISNFWLDSLTVRSNGAEV